METRKEWPISLEWMLYLVVVTMPIGFRGIGINSFAALGNISVSDLLLVPLLIWMVIRGFLSRMNQPCRHAVSVFCVFTLCYMLIPVLSIWNVIRIDGSVKGYLQDIFKIVVCLLYAFVIVVFFMQSSSKQKHRFVIVCAVTATVFAAGSIIGVILYRGLGIDTFLVYGHGDTIRACSFQHDPNIAAIYQLMSMSYCFAWLYSSKRKIMPMLSIIIVLAGTLFTASKAVVLTTVLVVVIMLGALLVLGKKKPFFACLGILIVCATVVCLVAKYTHMLDSLMNRLQQLGGSDISEQTTGRSILWEASGAILFDHPMNFLTGIGIGMFGTATQFYQIPSILNNTDYVHNTLLSFLVECGAFQLLILCVFLIVFLSRFLRVLFIQKNTYILCLLWGVISVLIFMNSVTLQFNRMAYAFIAFVACALQYRGNFEEEEAKLTCALKTGVR